MHTRPQNQVLWRDGTENVKLEICFTATAPVRKRKERNKKDRQCTPDCDWHTGLVKQSAIMDGIDVAVPASLKYTLIVYRLVSLVRRLLATATSLPRGTVFKKVEYP